MFLCFVCFISGFGFKTTQADSPFLNVSLVVVGYIAPIGLSSLPYSGPVFSAATDYVNEKYASILRFQLKFLYDNERKTCPDLNDMAGRIIAEWHYRQRKKSDLSIYMSTACAESSEIPYFQSQWNTLWFTTMAVTMQIRNRVANPTWIGFNHYSSVQCADLYLELCNKFNWTTVVIVMDTSSTAPPIYLQQASNVIAVLQKQRHITLIIRRITTIRGVPFAAFAPILDDIRMLSRVILFFGHATFLREFLITAESMNMTNGDYVYFALETMKLYQVLGKLHWQYDDDYDQVALQAFQSLLVVQYRYLDPPPNTKLGPELIRRSILDYNFTYNLAEQFFPGLISSYLGILAVAEVLNDSLIAGTIPDYQNGTALARLFLNRTFINEYGMMYVDRGGERRTDFVVTYFDSWGIRIPFLTKFGSDTSLAEVSQLTSWGNSTKPFPPPNVPHCGYLNDRPPCTDPPGDSRWTTAFVAAFLSALVGIIVLCTLYLRYSERKRREQLLYDPWWQIANEKLQTRTLWNSYASSFFSANRVHNEASLAHSEGAVAVRLVSYQKKAAISFAIACEKADIGFVDMAVHKNVLKLLRMFHGLEHQNLCRFYGLTIDKDDEERSNIFVVFACPARGSLPDLCKILVNKDLSFTSSLVVDFLEGLEFIHSSAFKYHGRLSIFNCYIDKHFTLKIMHLASDRLRHALQAAGCRMACAWPLNAPWEPLFWLPPEVGTVDDVGDIQGTPALDIFSSGFILYDLFTKGSLFRKRQSFTDSMDTYTSKSPLDNPLTEYLDFSEVPDFANIIRSCLANDPLARPTIRKLRSLLVEVSPLLTAEVSHHKLFDKIYTRLCAYSAQLEEEVAERARALKAERSRCDALVRKFLPKEMVRKLRAGLLVPPESFDSVTIMFTDLFGFVDFVRNHSAEATLGVMAQTEEFFDVLSTTYAVYKVEAIGDSFMVASGLPKRIGKAHVSRIASFALAAMETEPKLESLRFRIGMHSGNFGFRYVHAVEDNDIILSAKNL